MHDDHDHHDGHDHHDHDHPHPTLPDGPDRLSYYQVMEIAVRELLVEKGILSAEEIRRQVEDMDARTPSRGAKVVARAWVDPGFRQLLLTDGNTAIEQIGLDRGPYKLVVVENTEAEHNLVVCTLCSCYPRWLLGLPPDWYKSRAYRSRAVREPRKVLEEFGTKLPDTVTIRVHDSTADMRYLVIPKRPAGTEGWDEERLAAIVTRDTMVGVALPEAPAT